MKVLRGFVVLVLALVAIAGFIIESARRWRQRTEQRLRERSTVVSTARGAMEYAERGEGKPVVVLHGAPGGYDQGLALADLLQPANVRFIAPSRPGYLRTPLSTGTTPDEQADAIAALLDTLNIREPVAVIGASGGGPASVSFALRHGTRLSRLVLLEATTKRFAVDLSKLTRGPMTWDAVAWAILQALNAGAPRMLPKEVASDPAAIATFIKLAESNVPLDLRAEGIINDSAQVANLPDLALESITVPTLVVHGAADTNVPYDHAEDAARRIPNATLIAVPGGNHVTTLADTHALKAMRDFLTT